MTIEPQRFKKLPVEVEAMLHTGHRSQDEIIEWAKSLRVRIERYGDDLLVTTNSGAQRVKRGDWIIRGYEGEFYPCPASVFDATYEAVTTPF